MTEAFAAGLSEQSSVADQLREDSYLATARGDALDRKALDSGVPRKAAVAALGSIRMTRQSTGTAITIPAGWGQLQTVPTPGQQPVAVRTTQDAVFSATDLFLVVPAVAVQGGVDGNIAAATKLLPTNPVSGFQTDGGFQVEVGFTNGVDKESDDELRRRVPIEVQGRVAGRAAAFKAAALRVAGVTSAAVLRAGDTRSNGTTVPIGSVEVYFKGAASLLPEVTAEANEAAVLNQTVTVARASAERLIVNVTVFCQDGVDTTVLTAAVKEAARSVVNNTGIGETVYSSDVVGAISAVLDVVSVTVPFADLRKATSAAGTFGNVTVGANHYADLADADMTVAVVVL